MERPKEDILAIAQFPYLIFGNGYIAMITGGIEVKMKKEEI